MVNRSSISSAAQANIKKLAEHLKTLGTNDNRFDNVSFDMQFYCRFLDVEDDVEDNDCGSSACAVGHYAILLGADVEVDGVDMPNGDSLTWVQFAQKYVGINPCGWSEQQICFDWLFSGEWDVLDNTPLGAAARIEHFLEHGIPQSFADSTSVAKYNKSMVAVYLARREALEHDAALV